MRANTDSLTDHNSVAMRPTYFLIKFFLHRRNAQVPSTLFYVYKSKILLLKAYLLMALKGDLVMKHNIYISQKT
jgi:hypothetical protein